MFKIATLLLLPVLLAAPSGQGETKEASTNKKKATYAVVVNDKNPCTDKDDVAKATIKKLFMKDLTQWGDGTEAKPYGRDPTSAEQIAFVKDVLGMNDAELARHWVKVKNQNGTTPPKEVGSERMLLKYVAKHEGAFGVVKIDEAKADGVKTLLEF